MLSSSPFPDESLLKDFLNYLIITKMKKVCYSFQLKFQIFLVWFRCMHNWPHFRGQNYYGITRKLIIIAIKRRRKPLNSGKFIHTHTHTRTRTTCNACIVLVLHFIKILSFLTPRKIEPTINKWKYSYILYFPNYLTLISIYKLI